MLREIPLRMRISSLAVSSLPSRDEFFTPAVVEGHWEVDSSTKSAFVERIRVIFAKKSFCAMRQFPPMAQKGNRQQMSKLSRLIS
jgi:hypothetical protein